MADGIDPCTEGFRFEDRYLEQLVLRVLSWTSVSGGAVATGCPVATDPLPTTRPCPLVMPVTILLRVAVSTPYSMSFLGAFQGGDFLGVVGVYPHDPQHGGVLRESLLDSPVVAGPSGESSFRVGVRDGPVLAQQVWVGGSSEGELGSDDFVDPVR